MKKKKNKAAVELGRRGGKKRALNLTPKERSEQARKAIETRWQREKAKGEPPDPQGE